MLRNPHLLHIGIRIDHRKIHQGNLRGINMIFTSEPWKQLHLEDIGARGHFFAKDHCPVFKVFTVGSLIGSVMILIYTNLLPVPLFMVVLVNVVLFMGLMSRMVPATALNSAVPAAYDRGAYMSINSSLQQMAGGFAAMFAGLVVIQETTASPLENFNLLGIIVVGFMIWCVYLVWRVKQIVTIKENG